MMRRRVDTLGRFALQVAWWVQQDMVGMPVIFASRHGETERSFALLQTLNQNEPLSPTSFGLSVHNAISALYSIARRDGALYQAIAAGPATIEQAVVEAASLLADGAAEVLLVYYEAPLAEAYHAFADEPECTYAWAWRLRQPKPGDARCRLTLRPNRATGTIQPAVLPHGLEVLRGSILRTGTVSCRAGASEWMWSYHA